MDFGDSWTHGFSASPGRGDAQVMDRALGWKVDVGQDGSGSGFVHTDDSSKHLFPDRAAALQHIPTDVAVIESGLNDEPGGATKFFDAVVRTLHDISPVQEHWVNPANVSWIIDPKIGHPTTDGHLFFGARVAQALEAVVRTG